MEATALFARLRQAASQTDEGRLNLWSWLQVRLDPALYRPEAAPGVVARELAGRQGSYIILKNPATHTYYRLSDRDAFLWQRMDGSHTVKDLVVAYFLEYGSFAFSRVATLVEGWRSEGMHEVTFDGSDLASGMYIYRMTAGGFEASKKMVLVK